MLVFLASANAKVLLFALPDAKVPDARYFGFWWNIGLSVPYFDHGDIVYDAASSRALDKLQRLQNRGLKICKGYNRRFGTTRLHNITKMNKLHDRREAHLNNFMYGRLGKPVLRDTRGLNTRAHDAPLFVVKVPKIEGYKRSIEYKGAMKWNNLPVKQRATNNLSLLRKKQRRLLEIKAGR